jgi:hypothetical protein
MILLTITDAEWTAYGAAVLAAIVLVILTQLFRADKVTPIQRDCEKLMDKIYGCATPTELEHLYYEVNDFLDDYKPTAPAKTITTLRNILYTAINTRGVELQQKKRV